MSEKISIEEKKKRLKEYKRNEYLKNAEIIKKKQKEYYYKKKILRGEPLKEDKYKITILYRKDYLNTEFEKKFTVFFD
jgi:hypothetical protein